MRDVTLAVRRKQDDPYPIPTRTQHFYQPVPNTNPYPIPTRTIYLTHVMACNAWLSGRCQGRAANVSSRCHAKRAYDIPIYTNSYHIPPTQNTHTIFHSRRDHPVRHYTEKTRKDEVDDIGTIYFMVYRL